MKATIIWASALVGITCAAAPVAAYYPPYCSPVFRQRLGIAPDCTGPGYYYACPNYYPASCNPQWTVYGPNYCVRPPFPPFNGMLPGQLGKAIQQPIYGQGPGPGYSMPQQPGPGYNMPPGPGYNMNQGPGAGYNLPPGPGPGYVPPNVSLPAYGSNNQAPGQPTTAYPYHPYMRSPRDFFMWREGMEDQMRREQRPSLIP